MIGNLTTRVERLEAQRPEQFPRIHRIIQQPGEIKAAARKRYEQEYGLEIAPADMVILRVIVGGTPSPRGPA